MRSEYSQVSMKDARDIQDRLRGIGSTATELAKKLRDTAKLLHFIGSVDDCNEFEEFADMIDELLESVDEVKLQIERRKPC